MKKVCQQWTAKKEYSPENRPLMHLYVEMSPHCLTSSAISSQILREHLSVYFKYVDHDYQDLKKILGLDPLKITILKCGTFETYQQRFGRSIRRMNPEGCELSDLLACQNQLYHPRREGSLYDRV